VCRSPASSGLKALAFLAPAPDMNVVEVERAEPGWTVMVDSRDRSTCPDCGTSSSSRHNFYHRTLRDLPAQGRLVIIRARLTRWRWNDRCDRRIFVERHPRLAAPFARRTTRLAEIVTLFGHSVGGRPSERLMARLGMPVSDTTILRRCKESATHHGHARTHARWRRRRISWNGCGKPPRTCAKPEVERNARGLVARLRAAWRGE
jgi:transposase